MGLGWSMALHKATSHSWAPGACEVVLNVAQKRQWPVASRGHTATQQQEQEVLHILGTFLVLMAAPQVVRPELIFHGGGVLGPPGPPAAPPPPALTHTALMVGPGIPTSR